MGACACVGVGVGVGITHTRKHVYTRTQGHNALVCVRKPVKYTSMHARAHAHSSRTHILTHRTPIYEPIPCFHTPGLSIARRGEKIRALFMSHEDLLVGVCVCVVCGVYVCVCVCVCVKRLGRFSCHARTSW